MTTPAPRVPAVRLDDGWVDEVEGWPAQMLAHIPPQQQGGEVHVHLHLHQAPQLPETPPTPAPVPVPDAGTDLLRYQPQPRDVTAHPIDDDLPHYGWWAQNWPRVAVGGVIATGVGVVAWVVVDLVEALADAASATGHAVAGVLPWVLAIGALVLLLMLLGGGKGGGGTFSGTVSGTWR
jgi:hypothetical protein